MLNKKNDKKMCKCPFNKFKPCDKECGFFREGIRYTEDGKNTFPFADCAINIIADNLEAMHQRTYAMQKEIGETKNVMALKILSEMGMGNEQTVVNKAVKILQPDNKKLLK